MDDREKQTILGYDVKALRVNIKRRKKEIKTLVKLIKRGAKHSEVFQAEIKKAKEDITTLNSYIKLIEEAKKNGN